MNPNIFFIAESAINKYLPLLIFSSSFSSEKNNFFIEFSPKLKLTSKETVAKEIINESIGLYKRTVDTEKKIAYATPCLPPSAKEAYIFSKYIAASWDEIFYL